MIKTDRKCNDCTLCCKLVAVEELNKPVNVWCKHCKNGCQVFGQPERPASCGAFECLWLMGLTPEWMRPKEAKFVLWLTKDGNRMVLFEDPAYPNEWRKLKYHRHLMALVDRGIDIIIVRGKQRSMITSRPETVQLVEIGINGKTTTTVRGEHK